MHEIVDIIETILRFFQDTNAVIAFFSLFVCFLTLRQRKFAALRCLLIIPYIILTNNVIGIVDQMNKYLVFGYIHFGYLVYFGILVLIMWFIFNENITRVLFFSTIAYIVENTIYQLGNIIYIVFFDVSMEIAEYNSPRPIVFLFVYEAIIVLTAFVGYVFISRRFKKEYDFRISSVAVTSIEIIVIFIIIFLNYYGTMKNFMNVITRIYAFAIDLFILLFEISFLNESNLKYENKAVNAMLKLQEKQYKNSKENVEKINIICHDIKRQIKAMSLAKNEEEKQTMIETIKDAITLHETNMDTGNEALNVVLSEKAYECSKNKISFSAIADGHAIDFMSNSDIYIVFSNALDNAIESLVKEEEGKRSVSVSVTKKDGWSIIEINNYCTQQIEFRNSLPLTAKKNKEAHGFGVKSIANIIEKYHGLYKITFKDDVFTIRAVFEQK